MFNSEAEKQSPISIEVFLLGCALAERAALRFTAETIPAQSPSEEMSSMGEVVSFIVWMDGRLRDCVLAFIPGFYRSLSVGPGTKHWKVMKHREVDSPEINTIGERQCSE